MAESNKNSNSEVVSKEIEDEQLRLLAEEMLAMLKPPNPPSMAESIAASGESEMNKESELESEEMGVEGMLALSQALLAKSNSPSMAESIVADGESEMNNNSELESEVIEAEALRAFTEEFLVKMKPPSVPSMAISIANGESEMNNNSEAVGAENEAEEQRATAESEFESEPVVESTNKTRLMMASEDLRTVTKEFLAMAAKLSAENNAVNFAFSPLLISLTIHVILELNRFLFGNSVEPFPDSRSSKLVKQDLLRESFPEETNKKVLFILQFWCADAGGLSLHEDDERSLKEVVDEYFRGCCRVLLNQENAPESVNKWIYSQSEGLIQEFFSGHPPVPEKPMLIAANVLDFNCVWLEKFEAPYPAEGNFYIKDGRHVKVPYMTSNSKQFINVCVGFKVLGIPYEKVGEDWYFMYILLPDAREGLKDLIAKISSSDFELDAHLPTRRKKVNTFRVPIVNVSFGFEDLNILSVLSLGLPLANQAMGIERQNAPSHLSIYKRSSFSFGMGGSRVASAYSFSKKIDFIADHPFIFLIKKVNGLILFIGHVVDPTASQGASSLGQGNSSADQEAPSAGQGASVADQGTLSAGSEASNNDQVKTKDPVMQPSGLKMPKDTASPSGLRTSTDITRPSSLKTPMDMARPSFLKPPTIIDRPSLLKPPMFIDRPSSLKPPTVINRPSLLKPPTAIARPSGEKNPTEKPKTKHRVSFPW
ncbi:hypothetical protein Drorol1_Dr00028017 [Drosera rotundifolia]